MNVNNFNNIGSLNSFLNSQLSQLPEKPNKEQLNRLASLLDVIQSNAGVLNLPGNDGASISAFIGMAKRIKDLTCNEDGFQSKSIELTNLIGQLTLCRANSMGVKLFMTSRGITDEEKKEFVYFHFVEKNPEQSEEIRALIDQIQISGHLNKLGNAIDKNSMDSFNSGILAHDPAQQLYLVSKLIDNREFEKDIDLLNQALQPFIRTPMDAPLKKFYDSISDSFSFKLLPEAVRATERLDRETALEFLPYLINLQERAKIDYEFMTRIVQNLNNLKKSGLLDQFPCEKTNILILGIKNLFTGDSQKDAELINFGSTFNTILYNHKWSESDVKSFESMSQKPHFKPVLLSFAASFLANPKTSSITLAAFPKGAQERVDLFKSLNEPFTSREKDIHISSYEKLLSEEDLLEMTSYLTSIVFTTYDSNEFITKILEKAESLETLFLLSREMDNHTLTSLAHPEKLLNLILAGVDPNLTSFPSSLVNLQDINIIGGYPESIPLKGRLEFVSSIFAVDRIRGIRLAAQLKCLDQMIQQQLSDQAESFPIRFEDVILNIPEISGDKIPFIGEDILRDDPIQVLYIILFFAGYHKLDKTLLQKFFTPLVNSPISDFVRHKIYNFLSMYLDPKTLEYEVAHPPLPNNVKFLPFDYILHSPDLAKGYGVDGGNSLNLRQNLENLDKSGLYEEYIRIFDFDERWIKYLIQPNLFVGDAIKDRERMIQGGVKHYGIDFLLNLEESTAIAYLRSPSGQELVESEIKTLFLKKDTPNVIKLRDLIFKMYPVGSPDNDFIYQTLALKIASSKIPIHEVHLEEERLLELAPFLIYLRVKKFPVVGDLTSRILEKAERLNSFVVKKKGGSGQLRIDNFQSNKAVFNTNLFNNDVEQRLIFTYFSQPTLIGKTIGYEELSRMLVKTVVKDFKKYSSLVSELVKTNPTAVIELLKWPGLKHEDKKVSLLDHPEWHELGLEIHQKALDAIKNEISNNLGSEKGENCMFYAWLEQIFPPDDPINQTLTSKMESIGYLELFDRIDDVNKLRMIKLVTSLPDFPLETLSWRIEDLDWPDTIPYDDLIIIYNNLLKRNESADILNPIKSDILFELIPYIDEQSEVVELIKSDPENIILYIPPALDNPEWKAVYDEYYEALEVALKAIFSGAPLPPDKSKVYAGLALKYHVFDEDENMFGLVFTLTQDDPLLSELPYQIYIKHKEALEVPPNVTPPSFDIGGIEATLSLQGLQDSSKAMTVHKSDLPPNATVDNWKTLRDGLWQRAQKSDKYSDFDQLWKKCLNTQMYVDLLDFSRDGDLIPPTKAQWAAILNYLLSLDLDERYDQLYRYAYALTACSSGQRQGIALIYSTLPPAFKYAAKGLEVGTETQMRAKYQLMPLIAQRLQEFLTKDERMLNAVIRADNRGEGYFNDVHDVDFIKNSVESLLGLGNFIIFDWYARGMSLSRDKILEIVLKHLNPALFVKMLREVSAVPEKSKWKSGEEPLGVLMGECITQSLAFWNYDEEETATLSERGAIELLKFLGVVTLNEPPIITNWNKELSFVIESMGDFDFGTLSGEGSLAKQIKTYTDERLKGLDLNQKCIYLHRWLQRNNDIKNQLSEKLVGDQKLNFEAHWKKLVPVMESQFVGTLHQIIRSKIEKGHPFSILTLNELKNELYKSLAPSEDRKEEFEILLSARINQMTMENLDRIVEGSSPLDTLTMMDAFEYILPKAARELFTGKINSPEFTNRRWEEINQKISNYLEYLKQGDIFEIGPFKEFCREVKLLLPPGDLTTHEGHTQLMTQFDQLITDIKAKARKEHVLTLNEAKQLYDPLAERLGHAPMEIKIK